MVVRQYVLWRHCESNGNNIKRRNNKNYNSFWMNKSDDRYSITLFLLKQKYYSLQDLLFLSLILRSMIIAKQKAVTNKRNKQFLSFETIGRLRIFFFTKPKYVWQKIFSSQILHFFTNLRTEFGKNVSTLCCKFFQVFKSAIRFSFGCP